MRVPLSAFALGSVLLTRTSASSPSDLPADTPISKILETANAQLIAGNPQDALAYYDLAISRDPRNYLSFFKRGATYLSLGRSSQAQHDFDKALAIKPDFEGALLQRAKLKARHGSWSAARVDYEAAGKKTGQELAELEEAQGAAMLADAAAKQSNWDECVTQSGIAISVASLNMELRNLRASCRFEKGEVAEGISDLQHVLQLGSGSTLPHMQISAMSFYSLGETDKGLQQAARCLQSDPDNKECMRLRRREKNVNKNILKARKNIEDRKFVAAVKLLVKQGDSNGLLDDVREDFDQYKKESYIHTKSPSGLYAQLVEMTCEAYMEMNNHKRAAKFCAETLTSNPHSLPALLSSAKQQISEDDFEGAIRTLTTAREHHANSQKVNELLKEAQTLLKRSKQKDYYKVLDVPRDASIRDIKKKYRKLSVQYHPDKAATNGYTAEEAQKKMTAINEAYDVLRDEEKRAQFDRGDDPNDSSGGNPFQGSPFGGGGHPFGHGFGGGQQFVFQQGGFSFSF